MSREHFEQQLLGLQTEILRMGAMVENAIGQAIQALKTQDLELARDVIHADSQIDRAQYTFEDRALILLSTQQPLLARDLRSVSAAISIASELERVGDYAEGIAEITLRLGNARLIKPLVDIPKMAVNAQTMLRQALDAYTRADVAAAQALGEADDVVDATTDRVQREILNLMITDVSTIEQATSLLYVVHNLERIADRATNIGERVIFMVSGRIVDLND